MMDATSRIRAFRRPGRHLALTEHPRAVSDMVGFWAGLPSLLSGPRGDGHAVLVIPGFLAGDESTTPLRAVLSARGFRAEPWLLGRNLGPTAHIVSGLYRRLEEIYAATGEPVSLVGWSLGGSFARELGRTRPELVRRVITLGSPLQLTSHHGPAATSVGHIYEALKPLHTDFLDRVTPAMALSHLPVPVTAIYTKTDGIVPWRACLVTPGPMSENVEVRASHCGLGFNHETISVVVDTLGRVEVDGTRRHQAA
jgi:pimeloyl-ACP methyl ester carboxylesterase